MINPTGKKLEKLLFGIFDDAIEGADRYNHNGSLWLIFTDEMRWVVEYTKAQTLWYNYYFFTNEMEMVGLDCVEDKDLIQKWFESRFLNINPVEDTIQNGVKNTYADKIPHEYDWSDQFTEEIEGTIQNGVKETIQNRLHRSSKVVNTIQDGVKQTKIHGRPMEREIEDIIQNGVKDTKEMNHDRHSYHGYFKLENDIPTHIPMDQVQDVVQNGVKHCEDGDRLDGDERFEDIIQNGVRESIEEYHHRRREVVLVTNNNKLS